MNIFNSLAQYTTQTYEDNDLSALGTLENAALFIGLLLLILVTTYVIGSLILGQIFHKAGIARWAAWVPFYNNWKLFELGGQHGALSLFLLLPVISLVGVVFMYIAMYNIGLKLGKPGAFVVLAIFLPIVWYIWLAVDNSVWNDQAKGATPSLTDEPKPTTPANA